MPGSRPNTPPSKGEGASGEDRPDTTDRLWEPVLEEHFRRSLSPAAQAKLAEEEAQRGPSVIKGVRSTKSSHTSPNPTTSPHQHPPISPYANHPFAYPPGVGGPPPPDPAYGSPYGGYAPGPPLSPHGAYYPPHAYPPRSPYGPPPPGAYGYGYHYPPPYYAYPSQEHPHPPAPRTPPQAPHPAVDEHFKRSLPKAQMVDDHFARSLAAGTPQKASGRPEDGPGAGGGIPVEDHFARSLAVARPPGTSPHPPAPGRGPLQRPYSTEGIEVRGPGGSPKDVDEHFKRALEKTASPAKGRRGSKPSSPAKVARDKGVEADNEPMDTD